MKRLFFAVVFLCTMAGAVCAQTPTLVQEVDTGDETGCCGTNTGLTGLTQTVAVTLAQAGGASNFLIIGAQWGNNSGSITASITDNKGTNTWNALTTCNNATTKDNIQLWYAMGVASGTQTVTVTFSAQTQFVSVVLAEYFNVATSAAIDGSHSNCTGATSPYNSGALTTTTANDLIFLYGTSYGGGSGNLSGFTAGAQGSGFTLLHAAINQGGFANPFLGTVSEYQVWTSSGSITPGFSTATNTTATYGVYAAAFKRASAGTAPSQTPRIVHVSHQYIGCTTQSPCSGTAMVKPQFPSSGNLLVGMMNSAFVASGTVGISAVTDSASNAWSTPSACTAINTGATGNGNVAQIFYAANAATSPTLNTITLTLGNAVGDDPFIVFYDITGAAASPFDKCVTSNARETTFGNVTGDTITPSRANGIVMSNIAVEWHDVNAASGTGVSFDKVVENTLDNDTPDSGTANSPLDEDNGNAHAYPTSTSALTFTWTANGNELSCFPSSCVSPTGVGNWASATISFVPAATGVCSMALLGVGCDE